MLDDKNIVVVPIVSSDALRIMASYKIVGNTVGRGNVVGSVGLSCRIVVEVTCGDCTVIERKAAKSVGKVLRPDRPRQAEA